MPRARPSAGPSTGSPPSGAVRRPSGGWRGRDRPRARRRSASRPDEGRRRAFQGRHRAADPTSRGARPTARESPPVARPRCETRGRGGRRRSREARARKRIWSAGRLDHKRAPPEAQRRSHRLRERKRSSAIAEDGAERAKPGGARVPFRMRSASLPLRAAAAGEPPRERRGTRIANPWKHVESLLPHAPAAADVLTRITAVGRPSPPGRPRRRSLRSLPEFANPSSCASRSPSPSPF